ncbi:MAG: hypothetical protein R8K50_04900 [Mariprofundus sp.]
MKKFNQYCYFLLPFLLLGLGGCASIQNTFDSATSGLTFPSKRAGSTPAQDINSRMMRVDQANDRQAARNALVRELINEADQSCEQMLAGIPERVSKWKLTMRPLDKLDETLATAIEHRPLDRVNEEVALHLAVDSSRASQQLATSIIAMIRKTGEQTVLILKAREEMDIHRYSLKQALQDVQSYHRLCSLELGTAEVARATLKHPSMAEKQAQIDALIQLRKTLIQQGLNTRAIQQKIDAVILDDE